MEVTAEHAKFLTGRRMIWGAVVAAALVTFVDSVDASTHDRSTTAETAIRGSGISELPSDLRVLTVDARSEEPGTAEGRVNFRHLNRLGHTLARFHGSVTCLSIQQDGTVRASGSILDGRTGDGTDLAGRDFAFTIETSVEPQRFSLPRLGPPGALEPCGEGRPDQVPVTHGGFRVEGE